MAFVAQLARALLWFSPVMGSILVACIFFIPLYNSKGTINIIYYLYNVSFTVNYMYPWNPYGTIPWNPCGTIPWSPYGTIPWSPCGIIPWNPCGIHLDL